MSEARERKYQQSSSSIFGGDSPRSRPQTSGYPQRRAEQPEFVPQYKEFDANEARYRNLYGNREPPAKPIREPLASSPNMQEEDEGQIAVKRRAADLNSNVFGQKNPDEFYYRQKTPSQPRTPPRHQTGAELRRSHQTSSIFGEDSPPQYQNIAPQARLSDAWNQDAQDEQKRQQNRMYSNMFDRDLGSQRAPGVPAKLTASNLQMLGREGDRGSYRNYDEYSVSSFRTEQMRSVLDSEIPNYTRPRPEPKINYDIPIERKEDPGVSTYQLTGLPAYGAEDQIRARSQGVHIVSIKPEINNVSGACNGKALVTIRGNDERFRLNMAYMDCDVTEYKPDARQATVLSAKDTWCSVAERPRQMREPSAESIRQRNIATSDNLFGGSASVGKWNRTEDPDPEQKAIHKTIHAWQRTKNHVPHQTRYF